MKGLWIAAGILAVLALLACLPVAVELRFQKELFVTVRLAGVKVFSIDPKKQKKPQKESKEKPPKQEKDKPEKPKFFKELKDHYGFSGAVSRLFELARAILLKFKKLLRHLTFDKLELALAVAGDDAAETAIRYGQVCAAVYPFLELLNTASNVTLKKIDITADFSGDTGTLQAAFAVTVKARILFLTFFAAGALLEFIKFKKQVEEDYEREQH